MLVEKDSVCQNIGVLFFVWGRGAFPLSASRHSTLGGMGYQEHCLKEFIAVDLVGWRFSQSERGLARKHLPL